VELREKPQKTLNQLVVAPRGCDRRAIRCGPAPDRSARPEGGLMRLPRPLLPRPPNAASQPRGATRAVGWMRFFDDDYSMA
jgi:hypothetical protein